MRSESTSESSTNIPLCVPNISGREVELVNQCLDSGWVSSSGPPVADFERTFAAAVGAPHAVATSSGTAALHIALLLACVGPGDEVVMPSLTFVAPANAVRYVGAYPVFVDVDPSHWQMDPTEVQTFLSHDCRAEGGRLVNRHTGRTVRAILPVDILGHPVDLDSLAAIARDHDLTLIEDATESLGAEHRGRRLGSISAMTAFSFNGNKLITTGSGGMLALTDPEAADRALYLTTQAKDDPQEFVHNEVGYNYRLSSVQAVIGLAQLERLDAFITRKREIAAAYQSALSGVSGASWQMEADWVRSSWWLSTVRLTPPIGRDRRAIADLLAASGIQTRPLWQPLHLGRAHADSYHRPCPVSVDLNRSCISLPSSTHLSADEQSRVIDALTDAVLRT